MDYINRINDINKLKTELDQFRPFDENILNQLKQYYRISLTYTSNAIEGNTLTETETKIVLEDGITIGGHPVREMQEVLGHSKAYDFMYELISSSEITEYDILKLHKLFYEQVDTDNAGKYRDKKVIITGTEYIPPAPDKIDNLMKKFCEQISSRKEELHPVDFASWLHLTLVNIHPFVDGNGRCARLLTNLALLQAGYSVIIIPPVVRNDYITTIKEAQLNHNDEQFKNFISEMVLESMRDYLRIINHLR